MEDAQSLSLHVPSMTQPPRHASRTERSLGPLDLGTEGGQNGAEPFQPPGIVPRPCAPPSQPQQDVLLSHSIHTSPIPWETQEASQR